MGNHVFAAMGLILRGFDLAGRTYYKFNVGADAAFEFLYVVDPLDWEVIPYAATRLQGQGIVMEVVEAPMPLMRHTLRQELHTMTEDDIAKCVEIAVGAEHVPPEDNNMRSSDMFIALAKHFCGGDSGDAQVIAEADLYEKAYTAKDDTDEQLLADPLLEAAYDDMDDEGKGEFREIGDAKRKKKYRAKVGAWKRAYEEDQGTRPRKRRRLALRPKAKAKAKAVAAPAPAAPPAAAAAVAPPAPPDAGPPGAAAAPPIPAAAPGPAAAPAAGAAAAPPAVPEHAHARAVPNYGVTSSWDDVHCNSCLMLAGQKKYSESPGLRDAASYIMRCFDYAENRWGSRLPLYRVRTASAMPGDPHAHIETWVQQNRTCCARQPP